MFAKIHLKFLWILIFALASTIFFGQKSFAMTYVEESTIDVDTTWTKEGSPYVLSTLLISDNVTLTIEAGVEVKFNDSASLYIYGKVLAKGTKDQPIIFTSNSDDFASNTDDYESCLIEEYDEEGNLIHKEDCEYYDFYDPYQSSWNNINFIDSSGSILENVYVKYSNSAFILQNSNATFSDIDIDNSRSGFNLFNRASANTKNISINNLQRDAVVLYNDSFFSFDNLSISNVLEDSISAYNSSSFFGKNLNFNGNDFQTARDALVAFNDTHISLENSKFMNCPSYSCITLFDGGNFDTIPSSLNVKDTIFDGGGKFAISVFGNSPYTTNISNSVFKRFSNTAFDFYPGEAQVNINITNNYWNDASGPYHKVLNENGLGESISEFYLGDIFPWLTSNPFEACIEDCISNIMFIPGMEGSRLYEANGSKDRELWFSRKDSYHEDLFLDEQGKSINTIYTKNDTRNNGEKKETGIIDEAIFGLNIYDSFIEELRTLKSDKIINDYSLIPYDWRLSLEDIIRNGKTFGDKNENLSYLEAQAFDDSFILKELENLAKSSKNGKVSIVAHSNGGLVTKALIQRLKDTENPLYDKIDKIFFVAVPQIGTPEAMIALLYGTGVGPAQLIMDKDISRALGNNMPTLYNLLPRQSYLNLLPQDKKENRLINFIAHEDLKDAVARYGLEIDNLNELEEYLLGEEGREKPEIYDITKAETANANLYNNAKEVYAMLDSWTPGENMKVIQVGGWGENTKLGIDYKEYRNILLNKYLSYKVRETVNGDGTVVLSSALYINEGPNVEKWLVDLNKFNLIYGNDILKIKHADILEIPELLNFIKSKIQNISFEDLNKIILKDKSNTLPKDKKLIYTLHSPLYLGVVDSEGRFTGRDKKGEIKYEIPGVDYSEVGEVQTLSIPIELAHTLKLYGYKDGVFALDVDLFLDDNYSNNNLFQGIKTGTDTIAELSFSNEEDLKNLKLYLDYEGDGIYEEEYLPEKEEIIVEEVKKVEDPGGVVLSQFFNSNPILPVINQPLVLGESINNIIPEAKIVNASEEVKVIKEEIKVEENIKNSSNNNLEEDNNKDLITNKESKENLNIENPKKSNNYKTPIIILIISLILISLKFIFKVL